MADIAMEDGAPTRVSVANLVPYRGMAPPLRNAEDLDGSASDESD